MKPQYCRFCGLPLTENCDCERIAAEEYEQFLEDYSNNGQDPMTAYSGFRLESDIIDKPITKDSISNINIKSLSGKNISFDSISNSSLSKYNTSFREHLPKS